MCTGGTCTVVAQIRETESVSLNGRRSDALLTLTSFTGGPIKPNMLVQCQKDNSWDFTSECTHQEVLGVTWLSIPFRDASSFYHSIDDQYWYKFTWSVLIRDHPNPSNTEGRWYMPYPRYLDSGSFVCDKGYPSTELCRFN